MNKETFTLGNDPVPCVPGPWLPVHVRLEILPSANARKALLPNRDVGFVPPFYAPNLRVVCPIAIIRVGAPHRHLAFWFAADFELVWPPLLWLWHPIEDIAE